MNQQSSKIVLSPKRIQEKADILETNLFKSIAKQTDPAKALLKTDRKTHPNIVVIKAISQLFPRFAIIPEEFIQKLEEFLQKDIPFDKEEKFEGNIPTVDKDLHGSLTNETRNLTTIISNKNITITINGIPLTKSQNGKIGESFFEFQQSPGELLKNGFINFKEINKYPIVKNGEKLLYISHEKQGKPGLTFDGNIIPVEEAQPFIINIGSEVEKIDDKENSGTSKGYFLQSKKNGVILLERDEQGQI
ncbi:hypothetical protein KAJ27_25730, partial [bacterium]|nr:hypothetical protein [bacterium]